jgi:hypothetical protein
MASYYIYLISSLPMLHFGVKPPISLVRFVQSCKELLSDEDVKIISSCVEKNILDFKTEHPVVHKWRNFETALRNELVKIRASRKKIDMATYLRQDGYTEPYISHLALNAYRNPAVLESERILDLERWRFLDELSLGHYFDLDFLVVYTFKLLILERWEKIRTVDKKQLLEGLLRS